MNDRQNERERPDLEFRKWRKINAWTDRVILTVLTVLIIFVGSGFVDGLMFLEEGIRGVRYHSFSELEDINPDTAAWLTVDGTHIDHPVVRSADNFDYLDKGFDGKFYAGGTLFLDMNNKDTEDNYCMIHGHNMAAGAMFGDLEKFLEQDFFENNGTGVLLTPACDYDIAVFAAGVYSAYDRNVFRAGEELPRDYIRETAVYYRSGPEGGDDSGVHKHVLALSTCTDDMTDNRTVVFCDLLNKRDHR